MLFKSTSLTELADKAVTITVHELCSVVISVILTEVFHGFPQPLE
jgi:hypothetical protein